MLRLSVSADAAPVSIFPRLPTVAGTSGNETAGRGRRIEPHVLEHQARIVGVLVAQLPDRFRQPLAYGGRHMLAGLDGQLAVLHAHERMDCLFGSAWLVVEVINAIGDAEHFRMPAMLVDGAGEDLLLAFPGRGRIDLGAFE